MYSNVNLTALERALKDAINKEIKKVDYDASIDKYGNSYVADILASVLGVEVERKEWEYLTPHPYTIYRIVHLALDFLRGDSAFAI